MPASNAALHVFLLKHSDVLLVLGSGPVIVWHLAKRHKPQRSLDELSTQMSNGAAQHSTRESIIFGVVHQLRQVFTALLLGLGLIKRKVGVGQAPEVPRLVGRLQRVVSEGIDAVNVLWPW